MSATGWTVCPKCDARNPDSDPDDEFHGTVRMDHGWHHDEFNFTFSFWCVECDWTFEFTEKDVP